MEITNFFLASVLVASAVAYPWSNARYQYHRRPNHHNAWTMENAHSTFIGTGVQEVCKTVVGQQSGNSRDTAVHVCDNGSMYVTIVAVFMQAVNRK